jgi:hypothetical protein
MVKRELRIRWIGRTLLVLAVALVCVDIYSGHFDRSLSLFTVALIIGVFGLALDLWDRTSPGRSVATIRAHKHPIALTVLFFLTMAALAVALVIFFYFDSPAARKLDVFSLAIILPLFVSYNLLIAFIKYLRMRHQNPTNSL